MRTTLLTLTALLLPGDAWAFGFGTTAWVGRDLGIGYGVVSDDGSGSSGLTLSWLPSFDLYPTDQILIQIHALDTLAFLLADSDVWVLGADVSFTAARTEAFPHLEGVIAPGGSMDLYSLNGLDGLVVGGQCRIGAEGGSAMKLGVYVVPGIGIAAGDFDTEAVWSGNLQLSYWFGG
jgi:hypothetical protein